jgi:hypothetical protein
MADAYFILALVYDSLRRDASWINPFGPDDEHEPTLGEEGFQESMFWRVMAKHVLALRATDQTTLDECLHRVDGDLALLTALPDPSAPHRPVQDVTKPKRTTEKGEGRLKIISALTKHHGYEDGSVMHSEPISLRELARQANIAVSTASTFFKKQFKGHDQYQALCRRSIPELGVALKLLRGEVSPHHLYGRNPPGEGQLDDD